MPSVQQCVICCELRTAVWKKDGRTEMNMIKNPILPGFNPDPCICRKGEDFYLAVSTFEWFPGIPVYHSRDLKNWELYTHVLTDDEKVDLKKLPRACLKTSVL